MFKRSAKSSSKYLRMYHWYRWPEALAGIIGLASIVLYFGAADHWGLSHKLFIGAEFASLFVLALHVPMLLYYVRDSKERISRSWFPATCLGVAILAAILGPLAGVFDLSLPSILHWTVVVFGMMWIARTMRSLQQLAISPLLLFIVSYLVVILLGALVLMLPAVPAKGTPSLEFYEALFMSTSAACVTGLSIFDISTQFTVFGQTTLLVLFQIGGLGIMTFAAFAVIASGSGMSLKDRVALGEVLNYSVIGKISKLILWIFGITIIVELLGVVALYGHWENASGEALSHSDQLYYSVFHSVSAFCNAGFSLQSDSLVSYSGDAMVMLGISGLIIFGGLGFFVIIDLAHYRPWLHPTLRRVPFIARFVKRKPLPRLALQTKLVVTMTLILLVGGSLVFWYLEKDAALRSLSGGERFLASFFHGGVTPRTAGFNSLDCGEFRPVTQFFVMVLMVIGASPGSTAGGLKTTAVAMLMLALFNTLRSRPVEVYRRRINEEQVYRVLVLLVVGLLVMGSALFAMMLSDGHLLALPGIGFEDIAFEVISAFGTVGLSTGVTGDFSDSGRLILCACMFAGRLGPLTLVLAIGRRQSGRFQYPEESVMLG